MKISNRSLPLSKGTSTTPNSPPIQPPRSGTDHHHPSTRMNRHQPPRIARPSEMGPLSKNIFVFNKTPTCLFSLCTQSIPHHSSPTGASPHTPTTLSNHQGDSRSISSESTIPSQNCTTYMPENASYHLPLLFSGLTQQRFSGNAFSTCTTEG